jgi:hypothetical protein
VGGEALIRGESHEDFTHGIQRQINQHLAATHHPVGSITYEEAEKIAEVVQHAGKRDSLTIDAHGKVELVEPHNGAMLVTSHEPHTAVFPTEMMKQIAMLIPEEQVSMSAPSRAPEAQHVEQQHTNQPHLGPAMEL